MIKSRFEEGRCPVCNKPIYGEKGKLINKKTKEVQYQGIMMPICHHHNISFAQEK